VDVSDSLDPMSLAAAGVDVDRLLWVRCGESEKISSSASGPSRSRTSRQKDLAGEGNGLRSEMRERAKTQTGFGWQHPRDQMRGIEFAIPSVVTNNQSNTGVRRTAPPSISSNPGMGVDVIARCTGEQVERDRESPRRGENIRDRRFHRNETRSEIPPTLTGSPNSRGKPWRKLEQALRTTDLLLHSGGWGVVVLDFGSISWVDARRIPLSTWFRFQRIVEDTPTLLVLLGEEPCAKGCASVALRCRRSGDKWSRLASSGIRSGMATLQGFEVEGEVMRSRKQFERSDRARWRTRSLHARSS
jgi:recombination protein RecA